MVQKNVYRNLVMFWLGNSMLCGCTLEKHFLMLNNWASPLFIPIYEGAAAVELEWQNKIQRSCNTEEKARRLFIEI